ncbi:MAG: phage baseplate assembly protein V [Cognaticolwellia aestuarii]
MNNAEHFRKIYALLNEYERRLNGLIIPAKVLSLSEDNKKIKAQHGSCTTPFIKWLSNYSGEIREYRAPSIGEQCLLINLTGGEDTSACVALFGIDSAQYPLPSDKPEEHKTVYPNGTVITHNHQTNKYEMTMPDGAEMVFTAPEKITFNTDKALFSNDVDIMNDLHVSGEIKGDKDITDKHNSMNSMRDVYHSHDHNSNVPPPSKKMK